jgi:long-chain acyl-CoA synthetase
MYQYTGGTTGVSKGVMLSHANLSKQVQQIEAWFPKFGKGGEIILGALPYFHVFGLSLVMNYSVFKGWTQVLVPRPQPEPLLEAIRNFRPTFTPLVPTMYIGILNHPDLKKTDMSCIKGAFSGSAPLPVEVIQTPRRRQGGYHEGSDDGDPAGDPCQLILAGHKVGRAGVLIPTPWPDRDLEDEVTDVLRRAGELIAGPRVMLATTGPTRRPRRPRRLLHGRHATMDEDGYFTSWTGRRT